MKENVKFYKRNFGRVVGFLGVSMRVVADRCLELVMWSFMMEVDDLAYVQTDV